MDRSIVKSEILTIPTVGNPIPCEERSELPPILVESKVLPAEHFEGGGQKVVSFATASGHIGALRYNDSGSLLSYLYSDSGKRIDKTIQYGSFLPYALAGKDVVNFLVKHGYSGVRLTTSPDDDHHLAVFVGKRFCELGKVAEELGLSADQVTTLRAELSQYFTAESGHGKDVELAQLSLLKDHPFVPVHATLVSDPGRTQLAFVGSSSITVYETRNSEGFPLEPSQWTRVIIRTAAGIPKKELERFGWLADHVGVGTSLPGEGDLRVVHFNKSELRVYKGLEEEPLAKIPAENLVVDPLPKGAVYFSRSGDSAIYRIKVSDLVNLASEPCRMGLEVERVPLEHPGLVRGLGFDPRGNFVLARVSTQSGHDQVLVLDHVNLKLSAIIPDVASGTGEGDGKTFEVDGKGNVAFLDEKCNLRLARTTLGDIAKGALRASADKLARLSEKQQDELKTTAKSVAELTLPAASECIGGVLSPHEVERRLRERVQELFVKPLAEATNLADLHNIRLQLNEISARTDLKGYVRAFDGVVRELAEKESTLVVRDLWTNLSRARELLVCEGAGSSELIEAGKIFKRYKVERARSVILSHEDRTKLHALSAEVEALLFKKGAGEGERLLLEIQKEVERYSALLNSCASCAEVEKVCAETIPPLIDLINALPDKQELARFTNTVREERERRKLSITKVLAEQQHRERAERMKAFHQLAALRDTIGLELQGARSAVEVGEIKQLSPLMKEYYSWMERLSESAVRSEQEKLEALFERHLQRLTNAPQFCETPAGSSWRTYLPVFDSPEIVWAPELKPDLEHPGMGRLRFVDNLGRILDPEHELLPLDATDPRVLGATEKYAERARDFFEGVSRDIPTWSEEWVVNEWTEMCLTLFGKVAKQQLRGDNGIIIVRSEAGLGKNMMWDIFAYLTQRSLTTFSCNANTEVEDLTFIYQYDPTKRGTYKLNSQFLERIQTPGSIILLDEVNALPPGVKKVLNSLFDYRRTLFLPDGRRIKAHPTVIFVGLENYASSSYQGVQAHSLDLVSRARVIELEYPKFRESNGHFSPYEAELYAKQLPLFRGVSSPDFEKMWHAVINTKAHPGLQRSTLDEQSRMLMDIKCLVQTAVAIRELHRGENLAGQPGYVFTPRDGKQVMAEIRDGADLVDALHAVVLPKIEDRELRGKVEAVISGVVSRKLVRAA